MGSQKSIPPLSLNQMLLCLQLEVCERQPRTNRRYDVPKYIERGPKCHHLSEHSSKHSPDEYCDNCLTTVLLGSHDDGGYDDDAPSGYCAAASNTCYLFCISLTHVAKQQQCVTGLLSAFRTINAVREYSQSLTAAPSLLPSAMSVATCAVACIYLKTLSRTTPYK